MRRGGDHSQLEKNSRGGKLNQEETHFKTRVNLSRVTDRKQNNNSIGSREVDRNPEQIIKTRRGGDHCKFDENSWGGKFNEEVTRVTSRVNRSPVTDRKKKNKCTDRSHEVNENKVEKFKMRRGGDKSELEKNSWGGKLNEQETNFNMRKNLSPVTNKKLKNNSIDRREVYGNPVEKYKIRQGGDQGQFQEKSQRGNFNHNDRSHIVNGNPVEKFNMRQGGDQGQLPKNSRGGKFDHEQNTLNARENIDPVTERKLKRMLVLKTNSKGALQDWMII